MMPPVAQGRRATLAPVLPEHYDYLYTLVSDPAVAWRWRFRGAVPSREEFISRLWDGVTAQYLVFDRSASAIAGLVTFYNYNTRSDSGYIAAISHPAIRGQGVVAEGCLLLVDQMVKTYDLRKIYFEAFEFNLSQYAAIASIAVEEGRLVGHERSGGRYWDFVTFALYRAAWDGVVDRVLLTEKRLKSARRS